MKYFFVFFSFICLISPAYAQDQHKVDSLQRLLNRDLYDTTKVQIIIELSREYSDNVPEKAIQYANSALTLAEKSNYKTGIGDAYSILGYINMDRDNLKALEYLKKSLAIRKELQIKPKIAGILHNIGSIYSDLGDYNNALTYLLASLKINEEIADSASLAGNYHNIGGIYNKLGNLEENLKYVNKALAINRKVGNKIWEAINLHNISAYYRMKNQEQSAFNYRDSARAIYKEIGYKPGIARSYITLGNDLFNKGEYTKGIDSTMLGLSIFQELGDNTGIAMTYSYLGEFHTKLGKYKLASAYFEKALALNKANYNLAGMRDMYANLSEMESKRGEFARSLEYYKLHIILRDSLNNTEKNKRIMRQQFQFELQQKEEHAKAEQDKKDAVQTITRNALIAGFILVALLAIILYNRYRFKKNANIVLEEKNQIISQEKEKSDALLLNILPAEVAEELKEKGSAEAKFFDNVTVLFTDFKSFTTISQSLSPQELVNELDTCFKGFDQICTKYNIEKIKTIGDAYLAVCGLPNADDKHAEKVILAALEIREFMEKRKTISEQKTFEIRIGINSGSVVAGIVGMKKFAYDIWGDTVNTAARMEQNSQAGKINISETTYSLVKDTFNCEYRGEIEAKNKGKLNMYFVERI